MVLNKVLELFCVKKKDSKKKGKAINPLCKEYGSESDGYNLFNQFDVVQDFSDHYYAKNSPGKTSKDWVKTIQNEWKLLQKDLPESIYVRAYEDRIDLLRAAIVGPAGTPYHDGLFFFDVRFPSEYPQSPPKVHYHSGGLRLNPNLYESGKVCLSLLNTWWGTGCEKWGKTMMYSLRKPPKHFESLVARHFHERERVILDACDAYISGAVVGSSSAKGTKHPRDNNRSFADFKKSLEKYSELLRKDLAANRTHFLKLTRDSPAAADEIVECTSS
uniref:UBC core domain-containing protein n=1 Tax=Oryza nivara TaxID=4536 RepID=A0A0E0FJ47_ORYNI